MGLEVCFAGTVMVVAVLIFIQQALDYLATVHTLISRDRDSIIGYSTICIFFSLLLSLFVLLPLLCLLLFPCFPMSIFSLFSEFNVLGSLDDFLKLAEFTLHACNSVLVGLEKRAEVASSL